MSVDLSIIKIGDFVCIVEEHLIDNTELPNWYIGRIIDRISSARKPGVWTLFQVIDIDNGIIKIINLHSVKGVIKNTFND
tara:strand:+ start:135 stop:374 length:240 start_codon:yes stop_codon:yes gene_type:complete